MYLNTLDNQVAPDSENIESRLGLHLSYLIPDQQCIYLSLFLIYPFSHFGFETLLIFTPS